jgi:hypothetical protein
MAKPLKLGNHLMARYPISAACFNRRPATLKSMCYGFDNPSYDHPLHGRVLAAWFCAVQGCQMAYFRTKNSDFGIWEGLGM